MKNVWSIIALILVIIGGLNWMVVGIFNFNVVDWVFAMVPWLATRSEERRVGKECRL